MLPALSGMLPDRFPRKCEVQIDSFVREYALDSRQNAANSGQHARAPLI